jgi:cell division transport system permease protein
MLSRILANTAKQIKRSGWVAWSSVAVMLLAFFIATIFAGIAFLSNQYVRFIETRDNVIVFFEVGTDQQIIDKLKSKWEKFPEIKEITFFSEGEAYKAYLEETELTSPIEHAYLANRPEAERKLSSSLDIRLVSLDVLEKVRGMLKDDILAELETMGYEYDGTAVPPIDLRTDDTSLNEFKEVFSYLRLGGAIVLTLLFVIIFFFTLMTVEFRTYNRMEEIGVMQLVGGSLSYIRAPYVLEGAFYGIVGALLSSAIIFGLAFSLILANPQSTFAIFTYERLSVLELPHISILGWLLLLVIKVAIGFVLGSLSSYIAIRKYIK